MVEGGVAQTEARTDEEAASAVRRAVEVMNHAMQEAQRAGLRVDLDVNRDETMGVVNGLTGVSAHIYRRL